MQLQQKSFRRLRQVVMNKVQSPQADAQEEDRLAQLEQPNQKQTGVPRFNLLVVARASMTSRRMPMCLAASLL